MFSWDEGIDIEGLCWGHSSHPDIATGCTVFDFPERAICSYYMPGSAPATREVQLLAPEATVDAIDALVFSGGSTFGLGTADGVLQYLVEQGRGIITDGVIIPIVPAACIYDLSEKCNAYPTADDAYAACQQLGTEQSMGQIGAGTGATVGKCMADGSPSAGGFGMAQMSSDEGIVIAAAAVVNAVGDIRDRYNRILAGAVDDEGDFIDLRDALQQQSPRTLVSQTNTTLIAVFTNVALDKAALKQLAKAASAGLARTCYPACTPYDGDSIFALSLGDYQCDPLQLGHLAAEVVEQAIINAVS